MMGTEARDTNLTIPLLSSNVTACEIVESQFLSEDCDCSHTVWGICVRFSNGRTVSIPDLCTRRSDLEILKKRLDGASLSEKFLPDIVDDYLAEVYGIHRAVWEQKGYAKKEA